MPVQSQFELPAEIVERLVHLLGHDDDFRQRFQQHPGQALASLGANVDPQAIPPVEALPPKQAFKDQADLMKSALSGTQGMWVFLK